MGTLRHALAVAVVLLAVTAAPAAADSVKVNPYRAEPGDSVRIVVYGCEDADQVFAVSSVFEEDVELVPTGDFWSGAAEVNRDARTGRAWVEVGCDDEAEVLEGSFVVVDGFGPDTGSGGLAMGAEDHSGLAWGVAVMVAAGAAVVAVSVLAGRRRAARMRG
ncbi:hypothetical protein [Thermoactinospora rubra]|uniref:hypothetical protein n=1 Tax=Thermoactinospora rubra TaxID=1088767 RepID=UPI00117D6423|nr:hypothetical protein [Thermoactinospora rubra]